MVAKNLLGSHVHVALRELGISAQRICLIGGGSRSPAWRQVVADVFGTIVVAPVVEEGPAFGAALQAGWCVRGGSIQHLVNDSFELDPDKECHSNPANREKYEETYLLYCRLSDELRRSAIFPAHRKLISG